MADYYTLITNVGAGKLVAAQAAGTAVELADMAFGDGGGSVVTPVASQTTLVNERHRVGIESLSVHPENANWLVIEGIIPNTVGGWHIREVGVLDTLGAMIAVAKFPETYKPILTSGAGAELRVKIILVVTNISTIELSSSGYLQQQSNWTETATGSPTYIRNKPVIPPNTALRTIGAGLGLAGGGQLDADRTIDIEWSELDAAVTVLLTDLLALRQTDTHRKMTLAQLRDVLLATRTLTAGLGLVGGGALSADRTIDINWPKLIAAAALADSDLLAVYQSDGTTHRRATLAQLRTQILGGRGGPAPDILVEDRKSAGTHGGRFEAGARRRRDLNTPRRGNPGLYTLAGNQLTMAVAGEFWCEFDAPAYGVTDHKAWLRNVTAGTDLVVSQTHRSPPTGDSVDIATGADTITVAAGDVLELQHQCSLTQDTYGFGYGAGFGSVEIYSRLMMWRT